MKLVTLGLLLLLAPATASAEPLHVTAKVVERPKQIILCGRIAYRAVVRYELVSVERGKLATKELLVVELCPEFRKVGETRKLRLRPVTRNDSFVDEFKTRTGPRWVQESP